MFRLWSVLVVWLRAYYLRKCILIRILSTAALSSDYLRKISDGFNFGQKKCPKIKPSEIFKRPKF